MIEAYIPIITAFIAGSAAVVAAILGAAGGVKRDVRAIGLLAEARDSLAPSAQAEVDAYILAKAQGLRRTLWQRIGTPTIVIAGVLTLASTVVVAFLSQEAVVSEDQGATGLSIAALVVTLVGALTSGGVVAASSFLLRRSAAMDESPSEK